VAGLRLMAAMIFDGQNPKLVGLANNCGRLGYLTWLVGGLEHEFYFSIYWE
jgi:hypothetical protein